MIDLNDNNVELQAQCKALASVIESVRAYTHDVDGGPDDGSSISNDTETEDSLDTCIDDLGTYIGCLANLTLSLEHPAPEPNLPQAVVAPVAILKVPCPVLAVVPPGLDTGGENLHTSSTEMEETLAVEEEKHMNVMDAQSPQSTAQPGTSPSQETLLGSSTRTSQTVQRQLLEKQYQGLDLASTRYVSSQPGQVSQPYEERSRRPLAVFHGVLSDPDKTPSHEVYLRSPGMSAYPYDLGSTTGTHPRY